MKFKIGDKVRIINSPDRAWDGKICIVIKATWPTADYPYRVREILNTGWECPIMEREIELTKKVGQQLVFSFMNEVI